MLYVLGNITEDLLLRVPRLPADGETLIASERRADLGGKGLNQAVIAARAGMSVRLIAPVGADETAGRAEALARSERIEFFAPKTAPTSDQSVILVDPAGRNIIVSSATAASALQPDAAREALDELSARDALIMQGNLSRATTEAALSLARDRGAPTILNPSPIQWAFDGLWPLVTTAIFNLGELIELSGASDAAAGIATLRAAGPSEIVVTLGPDGAHIATGCGTHEVGAAPATVVDTAGAGDTFAGVYIAARAHGLPAAVAGAAAARAAALTVARHGTHAAFPSAVELAAILEETPR